MQFCVELESQPRTGFRFNANKNAKRSHFAKKENILKSRRREVSKELKRKREGQVKILRKYRFGEIPDVQIPLSAILKPLQILAKVRYILILCLHGYLFDQISARAKSCKDSLGVTVFWLVFRAEAARNTILSIQEQFQSLPQEHCRSNHRMCSTVGWSNSRNFLQN